MAVQFLHGIDLAGTLELKSLSTNTSSTTALVMSGDEVQKRTLGSNAFNSTNFSTFSGSYSDLTNVPTTFAPSSHNHAASEITSGTLATARIPSLAASKITSGTFSASRIAHNSFDIGDTIPETGRSVHETGIYTFNRNNGTLGTGTSSSYYSVLAFGQGAGGSVQIAGQWTGGGNKLYWRSLRDTLDDWWTWKEIYHTGHKPTYTDLGTMAYSNLTGTPTIPTDHGDHDGLYIPVGGGQFTGALDFTPDTGAILKVDNQTIIERTTANGGLTIGHDDSIILAGGDTSGTLNTNINNATETVFIGAEGGLKVYSFPNNMSGTWAARQEWTFDNTGTTTFPGNTRVGDDKYILTVNAPTNLTTTIVNSTINVTFTASTTTNIDYYLVFSSVDGGDYGLISVIPPADFGATMSIIDDSFDATGTQAYRVYAVKNGVYSSPLTGSKSYSVTTPLEPTNMSVVNLNKAYYVQWDPPSSNTRFVTAYNVYKHEHATQGSLSRSSATLIYSGLNTSYMYQISGANNNNFHQFWVETTIA